MLMFELEPYTINKNNMAIHYSLILIVGMNNRQLIPMPKYHSVQGQETV
jgi:hypothetical protein